MTSNEQFIDLFYKVSGRSSRSMYWTTILVTYITFFLAILLASSLGGNIGGFAVVIGLIFAYTQICNNIRRVHDLGYSGWVWFAAIFLSSMLVGMTHGTAFSEIFGALVHLVNFIILGCVPGEKYKNKYGHPVVHPNSSTMQHAYSS